MTARARSGPRPMPAAGDVARRDPLPASPVNTTTPDRAGSGPPYAGDPASGEPRAEPPVTRGTRRRRRPGFVL